MDYENIIMISVIGVYMAAMLAVGWWCGRVIKGLSDFLVAGRKLGMVLATATMFATWFGACSSMGTAGTVYKQGLLGIISDPFGASLALILAGLFYAAAFRRLKLLTVLDIFGQRYSKGTEIFAALLMIPVYIGWLGSQIVAIGFILSSLTKISPNTGMIIGAAVTLIYTYAGGMWAVTLTDFVQMIILIAGILVILPAVVTKAGGLSGLFANTPPEFIRVLPAGSAGYSGWISYLGKWLIMGLGCIVGQDLIQRSLSSKNESVARWSAIVAGIIYFAMGLVIISLGLSGRLLFPNLSNAEQVLPTMAQHFLNPFFLAVFVSGLLAAIMSSADSSLLAAVSLFINNIVRRVYPHLSEGHLLSLSRVATVIAMILSVFIALYVGQVYNLMVNSWATLLVSIFVPVTVALFRKEHAYPEACWLSMVAGLVTWLGYIVVKTGSFDINDSTMEVYYMAAFYGFAASIAGYLSGIVFRTPLRHLPERIVK